MPGAMKKLKERRTPANAPRSSIVGGRLVTSTPEGELLNVQEIPGTADWEVVGKDVPGGNLTERLTAHDAAIKAGHPIGSAGYKAVFKRMSEQTGKELEPFKSEADYKVGQIQADNYRSPGAYAEAIRASQAGAVTAPPPGSPVEDALR
jgi:hypothetical protein